MWSKSADPASRQSAVAHLLSVLQRPRLEAKSYLTPLIPPANSVCPEHVAQLCATELGFLWLDGASTRQLLFRNPLVTLTSDGQRAHVHGPGGEVRFPCSSLDLVAAALEAWGGPSAGMLTGAFSYEIADELEEGLSLDQGASPLPRLYLGLYDSTLVEENGRWHLRDTDAWSEPGLLAERVLQAGALLAQAANESLEQLPQVAVEAPLDAAPTSFQDSTARIVRRIFAGDFFQTNLCRHLVAPFEAEAAFALYQRMRRSNPSRYGAFLQMGGGRSILSSSPELFLKLREGVVETQPIKGTRRRGHDEAEDRSLCEDLVRSAKDSAELAMIVDVSRNDLGRVCIPGSVEVAEHASLLTLPSLHHTVSRVTGRLRPTATPVDLLRASFPPASITGAPKIAAMQAALAEEQRPRGVCMGSLGWISLDGDLELSVAIRTAYTADRKITYLAGCGITADSDPALELQESGVKAAAFLAALGVPNVSA